MGYIGDCNIRYPKPYSIYLRGTNVEDLSLFRQLRGQGGPHHGLLVYTVVQSWLDACNCPTLNISFRNVVFAELE